MIEDFNNYQEFFELKPGVFVSHQLWNETDKVFCINVGNAPIKGDIYLYRYVSFSRLYTELKDKTLTFILPKKWDDPYESLFFQEDDKRMKETKVLNGCLCFTYNRFNGEDAAWKIRKKDEPIVKVGINLSLLIETLSQKAGAREDSLEFYISLCNYSFDKKEINNLYNGYKKNNEKIELRDYLNYMSVKRKAFTHECEIRIFATSKTKCSEVYQCSDINYKAFVTEIILPPLADYDSSCAAKYYREIQDAYNAGMKDFLNRHFHPLSIVKQSRLYQCELNASELSE